jgi:hypothetical protein
MLATLAFTGILDPFRDSVGSVLKPGCGAAETVTNGLASVAGGGCDCIADSSTGSASYATCGDSGCGFEEEQTYSPTVRASPPVTFPNVLVKNLTPPETPESLFLSIALLLEAVCIDEYNSEDISEWRCFLV